MTQMQIGMVVATTLNKELRESEGNEGCGGSGHWQAIEAEVVAVVLSPTTSPIPFHCEPNERENLVQFTCKAQNTKAVLKKHRDQTTIGGFGAQGCVC
jgi:hypothetical protein